ncbi:P-loop containing nucleoside triphosphate hydrolase [Phytophthora cactorum]|nr:P-loop containing nucleoside triphosphate hydrolase [Phytophthora cactorum]
MEEDKWDDALLSEIEALESRHLQTRSHQNQIQNQPTAAATTSLSSSSSSSGVWSCRSCTLQNEVSRANCQVCSTPRGHIYQASSTATPARKTVHVQARLSFGGTAAPVAVPPSQQQRQQDAEQDVGRSEPSPFTSRDREQPSRSSQTTLSSAATGSGLVLTSRRSGQVTGAATTKRPVPSPIQVPRQAAGEDAQAKTKYLDIVARSNFPQIDYEAAQHFVYPTNYSIRDYQLTIAEKALYHNTLVSLPTGLGKTLVAAVVMYNFYRWFPTGKIVFMAPTKPLVAQQIKACHEIMGIPLSDTAELQGNVPPTMRRSLQNDLRRGVCAAEKFVCIVVDEAHRATGNYAYCCVVQEIEAKTHFFRVLALSATPGAKFDVIQDVVTNLRISHIESRSADDSDVKKYTHARQEEVIVCRLGAQIMEIKTQFLKFFTPIIQRLLRISIIQNSDPEKLSSWYVLQAREKFRKSPNYASNRSAESDLALLVSLLHAKTEERQNVVVQEGNAAVSRVQALEASLAVTDDGNSSTNTNSHPKLVKLRQVLLEHFQRHAAGESSTLSGECVEIVALLRPLAPLLNVQPFIGQGASGKGKENKGQSQKVQQEIVRRFRLGEFNVLVATCIAEEGLDIGEVDLIVSFDALTSPVRMIQRMGRTGRKRVGRVIILVTEGDEQKKLARSASAAKTVSRALTMFKSRFTYSKCPRMLPTGICPQLRELEMKIPTFHASQVGGKATSAAVDPNLWQLSDAERASLVRKIHGVEEILETESDDEDDKSEANGDKTIAAGSDFTSERPGCSNKKHRRIRVSTDNAETDSEIGSPWRQPSTPIELDGDSRCDDSFAAMNESVNSFDMHFSPQFVDSATQLAFLEEDSQPKVCSKRRQDDLVTTPTVKKQKTLPSVVETPQTTSPLKTPVWRSEDASGIHVTEAVPSVSVDDNPLEQTENVELPPPEPPSETQLQSEKHGASPEVQDEEDSAFSFALLPPDPITVQAEAETKEGSGDEDQAEEEASGFSFALLPSLNTGSGVAPIKPRSTATPQLVEDGTDGDEADETCEVKPAGKNELVRSPGTNVTIIDLTEKEDHGPATKHGENEETTPSSKPPNGKKDATQQAVQSQRKEAEQEEEEDGCCSICLESESYDDDPIVFCDGCNVAVHQFCYGIRVVPSDKWFCDVCTEVHASGVNGVNPPSQPRCQLCPHRCGAFKRTTCGQWVHVQCFLWIPEFRFSGIDRLDPDRKTLDCSLCHSQKGNGVIQCAHKRCLAAFHVSCAAFAHYRMDQLDPPKDEDSGGGTLFLAYCPLHRNSTAPITIPQQQKTPVSAKTRSSKPPTTRISSPSLLLASPSSAEAKKKFKTFRRLKQNVLATSDQISSFDVAMAAETYQEIQAKTRDVRVLAAAYIDGAADVRGARGEDDDEDDYGDDYKDAADDSFINDSSQLLYSQSVVSPEDLEFPTAAPRGGRQLGALPSNGIIRACLDQLHNGPNNMDTPSPRPRSRSRVSEDAATPSALSAPLSASATVTESDGDDSATEAEPSPSFNLLGAAKPLETVQEGLDEEGGKRTLKWLRLASICLVLTALQALQASTTLRPQRWTSSNDPRVPTAPTAQPMDQTQDTSNELHKKIEANRLKALKKLEERRQAKLQQAQPQPQPSNDGQTTGGFTSAAAFVSKEEEADAPSFNLGSVTPTPARGAQRSLTSTIDLTSPKLAKPGSSPQPKWVIFVSSAFASSTSFPVFLSTKRVDCTVAIADSMEADALLSVRTAVLFLTGQQLHKMALASPTQNVIKSRRVGMLLAMHKKIIIAVVHDGGDPPEVQRLRQFPNATVIVQPHVEALCKQLHQIAQQELVEGYELPSPSQCRRPDFSGGVVRGLDADFASRLKFFRSIPPISLGSALSLSFRFKNFPASQVPVLKFNEMHWRRMLPWISESTAEEIREHVQQNVRR